jgi:hypothetical protein
MREIIAVAVNFATQRLEGERLMLKRILGLMLAIALAAMVYPALAADDNSPYPDSLDPFTGDYQGRWSEEEDIDPEVWAQVIPLGRDQYRVRITSAVPMRVEPQLDVEVEAKDGVIEFGDRRLFGRIENGKIAGGQGRVKTFEMTKVERLSPTLGLEAPEGATVLFDGTSLDAWQEPMGWSIIEGGVLMQDADSDNLKSKESFKDCLMHIEFRLPYLPRMRGQQRGNSGVFLQDTYEVQVLDTYGLEGYNNECGAIYKVAAPKVNACAPPLQWQTYDIEYRAGRFDSDGNLTELPTITVRHNGVLIHNAQEIPWITGWKEKDRLAPHPTEAGPIRLQAHNNPMQWRNIWVKPL